MYRSRSRERYRSPSPSSKRRKHTHYSDRSTRSRSRSIDRDERSHRHRSSQRHSSHRSSRYYDDYYESSSRRHDYANDSRSREDHYSSHSQSKDGTPESNAVEKETQKPAQPDKEDLLRQRREQLAKWKREREAAKKAEDEAKAKAEAEAEAEAQAQAQAQAEAEAKAAAEKEEQQEQGSTAVTHAEDTQQVAKEQEQKPTSVTDVSGEEDQVAEGGKKWSLEDDDDDDDDDEDNAMEVETAERESADAERSFKPLNKEDDEAKDETFGSKQLGQQQRNIFGDKKEQTNGKDEKKQSAAKPKSSMKIGFGLGKNMVLKKATPGNNINNKSPAGRAKVEAETPEPKKEPEQMDADNAEDVDPLEAYMMDVRAEARKINEEDKKRMNLLEKASSTRMDADEDEVQGQEDEDEDEIGSDPEDILAMAAKKVKKKDLAAVDHSQIDYEPFRKDFYIEPPELRDMTPDQVEMLRIELDGIKIRGVNCPKPITKWTHCGLPAGCLEVIKRLKFEKPTAIQAQGIPAIMNGRDVIGVAKTGSGKTIAFLLPMFRHIKDQRPLEMGEGPIAVIMTPTRELATQIHRECKPFLKVLGLRAVCAYGGSPIKDQIADLKRGAEIIVCTPGRMIDLLCANSGRVTNLRRTTYLVLDEADRMFDMGFEPQVMKIVNNVRPNKQTVLFSATFPRQMEALARKVLKKPLEITVGGRSVVCSDVEQHVEVIEESTKFVRLLEILGDFFNKEEDGDSRALVFVDRQEAADNLLRDLIRRGYLCQSLHGGKDQADRNSTISDFKSGVSDILIATSVAARGLDVKQLKLVVNYECPNHMEDYVHRVGRTGRAGNKGTAYTFITPDQGRYALDICKALKLSGQEIPPDLQELMDKFQEKVKAGEERFAGSGFGGKGLERFDKDRDMVKRIQKMAYGGDDMEESEDEEFLEEIESKITAANQTQQTQPPSTATAATSNQPIVPGQAAAAAAAAAAMAEKAGKGSVDQKTAAALAAKKAAAEVAARINAMAGANKHRAHEVVADINNKFSAGGAMQIDDSKGEGRPVYAEEIVINDYPQKARWRVTNKEQISQITEVSGAAITTRGTFFPPGKQPGPGERKLYLFIEGDSELVVEKAKNEIKRILVEATVAQMEAEARTGGGTSGRYSVV